MTKSFETFDEFLAWYWLIGKGQSRRVGDSFDHLKQLAVHNNFLVSDAILRYAARHLDGEVVNGDIDLWIVYICFNWHPHNLWNFMIDAVAAAKNDDHLEEIAVGLAEHILAHYGSMVSHFEFHSAKDYKFKRMLTGVWRHRMSDAVWIRLRAIQSEVPEPLSNMIALEHGVEYMSGSLSRNDRETPDKGYYRRDAKGDWQKMARNINNSLVRNVRVRTI